MSEPRRAALVLVALFSAIPALGAPAVATGGACQEDTQHLCLLSSRFEVSAHWRSADGGEGDAYAQRLTADTGYFWFFNPSNVELVIKVLDGCPVNDHVWVFASGLTNVAVELVVRDAATSLERRYARTEGPAFAPLQDTRAFALCQPPDEPEPEPEPEPPPPAMDWSRDVISTALELDLATLEGRATIVLAPSPSQAASFAIGDLAIHDVLENGQPLRYEVVGQRLDVGVPEQGEETELVVDYSFRRHNHLDGYLESGSTYLWPTFCANLYPCKPNPDDGARYTLDVRNPPPGEVLVYPHQIPENAPSYMPGLAAGPYEHFSLGSTQAGTEVGVWFLPEERASALFGTADLVAVFDWLERTLGSYAFGTSVGAVAAWEKGATGGIEQHPFWHVGRGDMSNPLVHAHEAAHGWFGNGVRLRCWEDFVLSEGTASYLAARAIEAVQGTAAGEAVWQAYEIQLEAAVRSSDTIAWPQSCDAIDILTDPLYSFVPYGKGAFFLRAVEQAVGREALDGALRRFYLENRGRAAGVQDLLDTIQAETGFDPGALAQAWLRELGIPPH